MAHSGPPGKTSVAETVPVCENSSEQWLMRHVNLLSVFSSNLEKLETLQLHSDEREGVFSTGEAEEAQEEKSGTGRGDLPLGLAAEPYLLWAIDEARRLAAGADVKQSALFTFTQLLRAHGELRPLEAPEAFQMLTRLMREWRGGDPAKSCPWDRAFGVDPTSAEVEFFDVWDKVRLVPGRDPFTNALGLATRNPLVLPPAVARRRPSSYPGFVSLAGWLQVTMGDKHILLPVERLGALLEVTPMTISRYRNWCLEDGYLTETAAAVFGKKGQPDRATEFRFDLDKFPLLANHRPATATPPVAPTPADGQAAPLEAKPTAGTAADAAAKRVLAQYDSAVGSAHKAAGDLKAILTLLAAGHPEAALLRAASGYANNCKERESPPKYRKSAAKFYGEGEWERFKDALTPDEEAAAWRRANRPQLSPHPGELVKPGQFGGRDWSKPPADCLPMAEVANRLRAGKAGNSPGSTQEPRSAAQPGPEPSAN